MHRAYKRLTVSLRYIKGRWVSGSSTAAEVRYCFTGAGECEAGAQAPLCQVLAGGVSERGRPGVPQHPHGRRNPHYAPAAPPGGCILRSGCGVCRVVSPLDIASDMETPSMRDAVAKAVRPAYREVSQQQAMHLLVQNVISLSHDVFHWP